MLSLLCILQETNSGCFGTFWSYKAIDINTSSILQYFEMTKSFLNIVYLNNPDINIKSKMATINLHTGSDKVCHFVCILILNDPYCSHHLYFMILWTDNFILFIQVVFFSSNHGINVKCKQL